MEDKLFLQWLYRRLVYEHGENPDYDYMHKFRAIIETIPEDVDTPGGYHREPELVPLDWRDKVRR